MTRDDYHYYVMRARQEGEAALSAACDAARERHEELAEAYRLRCEQIHGLFPADTSGPVPRSQPTRRREPIVSASKRVLAASSATAPRPRLPRIGGGYQDFEYHVGTTVAGLISPRTATSPPPPSRE